MSLGKQYKHIFFDLDHTIWDFDTNASHSLEILFLEYDLKNKLTVGFKSFLDAYLVQNRIMWSRFENGFISSEELKWKRMWRTLLSFKVADEELARKMSESFLKLLPIQKHVFPYTFEILDYLKSKNYRLHLITNGFEITQRLKLENSGLDKYFKHVITSEHSQSMKPKKEIFTYAMTATSALPNESIMIGDNLQADIQGAINAGIDSVFVNHTNKTVDEIVPTYEVKHLKELESIL